MRLAIQVEALKLRHSLVGAIATLAMVAGVLALLGGITAGVANGNPQMIAQAGPAGVLDWPGLLAGATQITAVSSLLGFGVVLAWLFGREFTDGTITGLFALPIRLSRIALAKLGVYALWAVLVGFAAVVGILILGLAMGYGSPGARVWAGLGRLILVEILTAAVAVPVAWIATVTRSVLAGVGGTIALVVLAQIGALAGAGGWLPLAAPALWAMSDGAGVGAIQLALVLVLALGFAALVCATWSRLQLDR